MAFFMPNNLHGLGLRTYEAAIKNFYEVNKELRSLKKQKELDGCIQKGKWFRKKKRIQEMLNQFDVINNELSDLVAQVELDVSLQEMVYKKCQEVNILAGEERKMKESVEHNQRCVDSLRLDMNSTLCGELRKIGDWHRHEETSVGNQIQEEFDKENKENESSNEKCLERLQKEQLDKRREFQKIEMDYKSQVSKLELFIAKHKHKCTEKVIVKVDSKKDISVSVDENKVNKEKTESFMNEEKTSLKNTTKKPIFPKKTQQKAKDDSFSYPELIPGRPELNQRSKFTSNNVRKRKLYTQNKLMLLDS